MNQQPDFALSGAVVPCRGAHSRVVRTLTATAAAAGLVALTWAGADVRIPLQPVPITLQTLFVLLAGALAGPRVGSLSQLAYVGLGFAGVPLFAGAGAGAAVLAGPTGGYLLGFVLAPAIVARWVGDGTDYRRSLFAFGGAALAILVLGTIHLALFYTRDLSSALSIGLLPFLPGDALKVAAAASIYGAWRRLAARNGSF